MINGKNHADLSTKHRTFEKRPIFFAGMFESQCKKFVRWLRRRMKILQYLQELPPARVVNIFQSPRPVTDA